MNLRDLSGNKGLTIIELLLVIAIVAIIGGTTTPFLSRFVLQTGFDSTVDKTISSIRKAQEYAMDGKNGSTWGVCKSGNNIRLYSNTCASPVISENFTIPGSVTVSNLTDTTFNKRGEPSGTISITVSTNIESVIVQLNSAGGINVN